MKKQPIEHPGHQLWRDWLDPLEMTVGDLADALGVTRKTVSAIINGRQAITPEMSVRLSKALGTDRDEWAIKQLAYDMAQVDTRSLDIKRVVPTWAKGGSR